MIKRTLSAFLAMLTLLSIVAFPAAAADDSDNESYVEEIPAEQHTTRYRDEDYRGNSVTSSTLSSNDGTIKSETFTRTYNYGTVRERLYTFPSGDEFSIGQLLCSAPAGEEIALDSFWYPGSSVKAKYYDRGTGAWREQHLYSGMDLYAGMYFITVDDAQFIICLPQAYVAHENEMLEWKPEYYGRLRVNKDGEGYTFKLSTASAPAGTRIEYMYILSDDILVDWSHQYAEAIWSGYQFYGGDNRWCYSGYYYVSPDSYYPIGENYYYRLPAAYIATKFVNAGKVHLGAKEMAIAMLDVMSELQNGQGFFPSYAGSTWLKTDYNIDPGYYDTRFNSDLVTGFLNAYELYGVTEFLQPVIDYGGFFAVHAIKNHTSVTGYDGWPGWLVDDYSDPNGNNKTHTSLNHQAAQITLMYRMYDATGTVLYRLMAEMMLRGIAFTTNQWISEDGNLKYALLYGQEVGTDYPYLTYNDLYELQELLYKRNGAYHIDLTTLMNSKRGWMDANGVTGYKTAG